MIAVQCANLSKCSNPYICATWQRKPLIYQTYIIWSNRIYSLKYLKSTTLVCTDIRIRKSKFVANTQFFYCYKYVSLTFICDKPDKIWENNAII